MTLGEILGQAITIVMTAVMVLSFRDLAAWSADTITPATKLVARIAKTAIAKIKACFLASS